MTITADTISTRTPCDRDPVEQATIVVLTPSGPLTFCTHHFEQYKTALLRRNYPADAITGR